MGEKGEQLGIMPLSQALELAKRQNLDLIEVAPLAVPPVCRLLDYGKYKYEQSKRERELRKSQRVSLLREIRLRPKIDEHDFAAKSRSVVKLLSEGDKVKITVMFRGREITHPELGLALLKKMAESTQGEAVLEKQPMMEGKRIHIILAPVPQKQKAAAGKAAEKTEEKKVVQDAQAKNT